MSDCRALLVGAEMVGLPAHRFFPGEAQPGEIGKNARFEFGRAAGLIYVFDAQQETAAGLFRHVVVEDRRQRMTEMQRAVRARRETEYRLLTGNRVHAFFCHEFSIRGLREAMHIIRG